MRARSTTAGHLWWVGLAWLLACWLPAAPPAHAAAEALPGPLVSAEWLQRQLGQPGLLVLDASPAPVHRARHIPGAVNVDRFSAGLAEPDAQAMAARLRSWGVSPGLRIVVVDMGGSYFATRLFHDLLHHGYPERDLAVLDGGMARWVATGGAVTQQPTPAPAAGRWQAAAPLPQLRSGLDEVLRASADPQQHLVEALGPEHFHGQTAWFDRPGHLPNARMWPAEDFFNADKTFKSAAEIRRMMDWLGIRDGQTVHAYCGGGIAASVPVFALRHIAGHPQVKLFAESQLGWLTDVRGLPVWTYAEPALLRDTAWLKTWGGVTMQQYGLLRARIVDLRTPEAFAQLRLPLAVNVPLAEIRARLHDAAALARLFAGAGVDPALEAVVLSDRGLDPDAALAFQALQRAGYTRASVYTDTLDHWAAAGHALARGAPGALAAPATPPTPVPTPLPTVVPPQLATGAPGNVRRVSLARAGAVQPDRVNLPWTELVGPPGQLLSAAELWTRLSRAGVPRYVELQLEGDDAAETALGALVLRLMGFGRVSVVGGGRS